MVDRPAVVVDWVDAAFVRGEVSAADLETPPVVHTAGWLVRDEPGWVAVALERSAGNDGAEDLRFVIVIPRPVVVRVRRVSAGRARRRGSRKVPGGRGG